MDILLKPSRYDQFDAIDTHSLKCIVRIFIMSRTCIQSSQDRALLEQDLAMVQEILRTRDGTQGIHGAQGIQGTDCTHIM